MTLPSRNGFFIALEGPNNTGKTTLAEALVAGFNKRLPNSAHYVRNPGSSQLGQHLRTFMVEDTERKPLHWRSSVALQLASTYQTYDEVIAPLLAKGKIVVVDRYMLSCWVFQCFLAGLHVEDFLATAGCMPMPEPDVYVRLTATEETRRIRAKVGVPDYFENQVTRVTEEQAYSVSASLVRAPVIVKATDTASPTRLADELILKEMELRSFWPVVHRTDWNKQVKVWRDEH